MALFSFSGTLGSSLLCHPYENKQRSITTHFTSSLRWNIPYFRTFQFVKTDLNKNMKSLVLVMLPDLDKYLKGMHYHEPYSSLVSLPLRQHSDVSRRISLHKKPEMWPFPRALRTWSENIFRVTGGIDMGSLSKHILLSLKPQKNVSASSAIQILFPVSKKPGHNHIWFMRETYLESSTLLCLPKNALYHYRVYCYPLLWPCHCITLLFIV